MEAIFTCAGGDSHTLNGRYKEVVSKEYFDGDLGTTGDGPIDLFLERCSSHPLSIVHLRTPNAITYRRTHRHIQHNHREVYLLWRIRRGGLKLTRSTGTFTVGEGDLMIYDSATPFFAELACDDRGLHDSLQVIVPAHMFREQIAALSEAALCLKVTDGPSRTAAALLDLIAERGHWASGAVNETLAKGLLQAVGETIIAQQGRSTRKTVIERRVEEIERYIVRNLTSRDLSANSIAQSCNISPRYLCYVLKSAGHTFSSLVWDKRLEKAKEWLISPRMRSYLVHEIATMAGYKSAAHFSRAFKSASGCTPSEYRRTMTSRAQLDDDNGDSSGISEALH